MIDAVISGALKPLVDGRCYVSTFPQPIANAVWPSIRFQFVSFVPVDTICGTGDGSTDEARVQIDYVAKTYRAVIELRADGRAALMTVYPPCSREGGFETYDAETKTHRVSDDYVFHPSSEATS